MKPYSSLKGQRPKSVGLKVGKRLSWGGRSFKEKREILHGIRENFPCNGEINQKGREAKRAERGGVGSSGGQPEGVKE